MASINAYVTEYKKQMKDGIIPKAYRIILEYIMQLKSQLIKKYPKYMIGNVYQGYMDMTYIPVFTEKLKEKGLKIAIVFLHNTCHFELWLSGNNRQIQKRYSDLVVKTKWVKYRINPQNADSIIEYPLEYKPDFDATEEMTEKIAIATMQFIKEVESFISKHKI